MPEPRRYPMPDGTTVVVIDKPDEPAICCARHPVHTTWICTRPANHEGDHA